MKPKSRFNLEPSCPFKNEINHVDLPPLHYQCYKVDKFKNCANCTHLEYQLRATNEE